MRNNYSVKEHSVNQVEPQLKPRQSTVDLLKQFARAYTYNSSHNSQLAVITLN